MSEPTYTIILTESERTLLAKAFGGLVTKLINAPIFVESASGGTQAARAVLSPPSQSSSTAPPAVAPQSPAPIEQRDRWARDRKGNEVANPEGSTAREVVIWKTEQKPKFLKVTWQSQERGYIDANCFDQKLWPWLIKSQGQKTTLYLVKATKGEKQYLNVVGVRA